MSPSLGWLQAFLSAAAHLDYERVGHELGLSAQSAWLRVQKLEQWLHKPLILDAPTELNEADGARFVPIAWEVLKRFEAVCSGNNFSIAGLAGAPRTKLISKVRLHDLERFLALATEGTFKGAADASQCDVATLHRTIKDLEKASESQLVAGRVSVHLTTMGEVFKDAASFIVKALNDFRAVIPDDYDSAISKARNLHTILVHRKVELQFMDGLIERTGKKQRGKVRREDVQASLGVINKAIDSLEEGFSPFHGSDCKTGD